MNIIEVLEQEQLRSDIPDFRAGDTVKVYVKVVEGSRERVQMFEGVVIARSGGGVRPGFEGGQMPIYRRLPKRGFKNIFAKKYVSINVEQLNKLENGTEVTADVLKEAGIISKVCDGVVILGRGELEKKLTVKASRFTKSAAEKIAAAGGKAEEV